QNFFNNQTAFTNPTIGQEWRQKSLYPDGQTWDETYDFVRQMRGTLGTPQPGGTTIQHVTHQYGDFDHYGNVGSEDVSTEGIDHAETVERYFVAPDESSWIVDEPLTELVCSGTATNPQEQCRSTAYTYYPTGEIETEIHKGTGVATDPIEAAFKLTYTY